MMNYTEDGCSFLFYGRGGISVYEATYRILDETWSIWSFAACMFVYETTE